MRLPLKAAGSRAPARQGVPNWSRFHSQAVLYVRYRRLRWICRATLPMVSTVVQVVALGNSIRAEDLHSPIAGTIRSPAGVCRTQVLYTMRVRQLVAGHPHTACEYLVINRSQGS